MSRKIRKQFESRLNLQKASLLTAFPLERKPHPHAVHNIP